MVKNNEELGLDDLINEIQAKVEDASTLFAEMNTHVGTMNGTKGLKEIAMDAAKIEQYIDMIDSYIKDAVKLRKFISITAAAEQKKKDVHISLEAFT